MIALRSLAPASPMQSQFFLPMVVGAHGGAQVRPGAVCAQVGLNPVDVREQGNRRTCGHAHLHGGHRVEENARQLPLPAPDSQCAWFVRVLV